MDQETADYLAQRSAAYEMALHSLTELLISKKLISRREATDAFAELLQNAKLAGSGDGVRDGLESLVSRVSR